MVSGGCGGWKLGEMGCRRVHDGSRRVRRGRESCVGVGREIGWAESVGWWEGSAVMGWWGRDGWWRGLIDERAASSPPGRLSGRSTSHHCMRKFRERRNKNFARASPWNLGPGPLRLENGVLPIHWVLP